MIYNRENKTTEQENEYKADSLNFLYTTALGRFLLNIIVARPWFSKLRGIYQKSRLSRKDIAPFAKKYGITLESGTHFSSFNDFFTRKKEIKLAENDSCALLSVADSKIRYYTITDELKLQIKNSIYSIEDILDDGKIAESFRGGTCIVFRLSVDDCHRYHYPDNGEVIFKKHIKGMLHTVRPISEKYMVYSRNTREVSLLQTENLGTVAQIEVGALLVGKIVNHKCTSISKMQEKGYFEFGGSTVVLLINKAISFDEDIARMNSSGIETKVKAGERIGTIC